MSSEEMPEAVNHRKRGRAASPASPKKVTGSKKASARESEASWAPGTEPEESSLVVLPPAAPASTSERARCDCAHCGRAVELRETGLARPPGWQWRCAVCERVRALREWQPTPYGKWENVERRAKRFASLGLT